MSTERPTSEERDDEATEQTCPGRPCDRSDLNRRRVLVSIGGVGTVAVAGCMGLFEDEEDEAPEDDTADEPEDDTADEETEDDTEDEETEDDTEDDDEAEEEEAVIYDVEFLEFDETLEVTDEEALLYAALDEGWEMEYSCESGRCGQCTARVDGDANDVISHEENHYLEDEQIEDGWLLTCTAHAEDDFALETNIHPDD